MSIDAPRRSIGAQRNPETEDAVLNAGRAILAEKGVRGLTMEAVARRARAGKATIYRWWPNRGALLLAIYERIKGDHIYDDTGTLRGDIVAFYIRLFKFWKGEGRVFALIIAEAQHDPEVAKALAKYQKERQESLAEVIRRGAERGELKPGLEPHAFAGVLIAQGWFHLLTDQMDVNPVELTNRLLEM